MEINIYDFDRHSHLKHSYLVSASVSHQQEPKSKSWFDWKHENRPGDKPILTCAIDENMMIGCVAFAPQTFRNNNSEVKCAIIYEIFVHSSYQRKGIFTKLLKAAEKECERREIKCLYVFPNKNSIRGFLNLNWTRLDKPKYHTLFRNKFKILQHLTNLKLPFKHNNDGIDSIAKDLKLFNQYFSESFKPSMSQEYVHWRYDSFKSGYGMVTNDEDYLIYRIGSRGALREVQVLNLEMKMMNRNNLKRLLNKIAEKTDYDFLSLLVSSNHPILGVTSAIEFISLPNGTNFCYKKIANCNNNFDPEKVVFEGSLYHTY